MRNITSERCASVEEVPVSMGVCVMKELGEQCERLEHAVEFLCDKLAPVCRYGDDGMVNCKASEASPMPELFASIRSRVESIAKSVDKLHSIRDRCEL